MSQESKGLLAGLTPEEESAARKAVAAVRAQNIRAALGLPEGDGIDVHIPMQNSDLTEGRGHPVPRGMFFDPILAADANVMLDGVQGTANSAPVKVEVVHLSLKSWRKEHGRHLRRAGTP